MLCETTNIKQVPAKHKITEETGPPSHRATKNVRISTSRAPNLEILCVVPDMNRFQGEEAVTLKLSRTTLQCT